MINQLSLRIKKVYFDSIIEGDKKVEYRQASPYYQKRFSRSYKVVKIYYNTAYAIIEIKDIRLIPNFREKADRPDFLATDTIYAISLGKVHWIENPYKKRGGIS
tara:strand:+ start:804 stop:1115 length:312 start_codon:yes stop_codon:yes gene_type:complete